MPAQPHSERFSPRPDEPDAHIRFIGMAGVFDFVGCWTAVQNFLNKWAESHNPNVSVVEINDGCTDFRRMPCEELWLLQ